MNKNYDKVFKLSKNSAEGGYSGGITMLAYCYENGVGVNIDKKKAIELYQEAANLENSAAQFNLALIYEKGKDIDKDIDKAIDWYKKSENKNAKNRLQKLLNEKNK